MSVRKNTRSLQLGRGIERLEARQMFADGTAIVEFVSKPSEILNDDPVDITVRYMLTGNSKNGPWDVNSLALYDNDTVINDKIRETTSLRISRQDRWYQHTFHDVDLANFVDSTDGSVDLFAQVKIDDKKLNFVDAKDSTPIYEIQAYSDLEASGISVSDRTVEPGQAIWVNFNVRNNGVAAARASETGVMFSSDATIGRSDRLVGLESLWRLGPDKTNSERRRVTIPENAVVGESYYIGTIVDYGNDNNEGTGESNNNSAQPVRVTVVDPRADLVVNSISVEHRASNFIVETVSPGQGLKLNTEIGNVGNSRASLFNLEFYWSSTHNGTTQKIADNWIATINAGNTNDEWTWHTVPDVPSGTYYITVVADSEAEVGESNEANNSLSIPVEVYNHKTLIDFVPGVTVITPGFQLSGSEDGTPQKYTMEMAEAILERAYGTGSDRGSIFISDPHTGEWVSPGERFDDNLFGSWRENSNDANDEIVLIYDWSWESNRINKGWSEAAGDNLFAGLADEFAIGDQTIDLLDRPLHFIGASRGTVVNTHAVRRIDEYFPEVTVDHFTTLDPHPASGAGLIADYGSEDKELVLPGNVAYADNFFRRDRFYEAPDPDFNGVEVPGAVNLELNESTLTFSGSPLEHSDVPIWYIGTIVPHADKIRIFNVNNILYKDWWNARETFSPGIETLSGRALVGYAYSRIGGRTPHTELMDRSQFAFDEKPASLFNGDFEYGNRALNNIPGWERHGGGGAGDLDGGYLQLANGDATRTHNLTYFPSDVTAVEFDYRVNDADAEDVLRVSVGDRTLAEITLTEPQTDIVRDYAVPLNFEHDGFVDSLSFALINPNGESLQSAVRIDNVELVNLPFDTVPPDDTPVSCDVTGDGSCNAMDIDAIHASIRNSTFQAAADYDGNGQVTASDADYWISELMNTSRGDANLDGSIDFLDFLLVSANYGQQAGWRAGDFDGDGSVAFADFLFLSQDFGQRTVATGATSDGWSDLHDQVLAEFASSNGKI